MTSFFGNSVLFEHTISKKARKGTMLPQAQYTATRTKRPIRMSTA